MRVTLEMPLNFLGSKPQSSRKNFCLEKEFFHLSDKGQHTEATKNERSSSEKLSLARFAR